MKLIFAFLLSATPFISAGIASSTMAHRERNSYNRAIFPEVNVDSFRSRQIQIKGSDNLCLTESDGKVIASPCLESATDNQIWTSGADYTLRVASKPDRMVVVFPKGLRFDVGFSFSGHLDREKFRLMIQHENGRIHSKLDTGMALQVQPTSGQEAFVGIFGESPDTRYRLL